MTIHYHVTPITPRITQRTMAGRFFCTSYSKPDPVVLSHEIGQGNMLDNGAYSFWTTGRPPDWPGYYAWCRVWLAYPTTWAVIPDAIDGSEDENDDLLVDWAGQEFPRGAPVWHMHESIGRLQRLCDEYERVCVGSSGGYAIVGSDSWHRRMTEAMNALCGSGPVPVWLHMLRGMSMSGEGYPFASVDSADIGRNHNREYESAAKMAERLDAVQCSPFWTPVGEQLSLV